MSFPLDPNPGFAAYAHPEVLVSAGWLSARLGTRGLRVLEADSDHVLYDIAHLPHAVSLDWRRELVAPLTRDVIDGESFAALMRAKGIHRDDTVVLYGDRNNCWAAYAFWIFKLFGHADVRLLDGGRDAWMAEDRDSTFYVPSFPASDYPVVERDDVTYRIFVDELARSLNEITVADVRSPSDYAGSTESVVARRPGHIAGAISVPGAQSTYPNMLFRPRAELEEAYAAIPTTGPTAVYCGLGAQSAHAWFTLTYLLGRSGVRNYDGSWAEWGNMIGMPIERAVDNAENLTGPPA